jgi:hypothetical protein
MASCRLELGAVSVRVRRTAHEKAANCFNRVFIRTDGRNNGPSTGPIVEPDRQAPRCSTALSPSCEAGLQHRAELPRPPWFGRLECRCVSRRYGRRGGGSGIRRRQAIGRSGNSSGETMPFRTRYIQWKTDEHDLRAEIQVLNCSM